MGATPIMQRLNDNSDYSMTLYEVCEFLGKSTRTVSRYIHKNILHPRGIKSRQGTLEYRFSRIEVEKFREDLKIMHPYFSENESGAQPDYAATNFADYAPGAPTLAPPQQMPYLVPGVSYPMPQNQFRPNPQVAWPSGPSQNFNPPVQDFDFSHPQNNYVKRDVHSFPRESQKKDVKEAKGDRKETAAPATSNKINEIQNRGNEEIISLLKETTGMLRDQLKVKDDQIKNLDEKIGQMIERNRETNILLKGLQDKMMLLEKPKAKRDDEPRPETKQVENSAPAGDEAASKTVSKEGEKESIDVVKIRILPQAEPIAKTDTVDEGGYKLPIPPAANNFNSKQSKREEPEKKGLFGKIFG